MALSLLLLAAILAAIAARGPALHRWHAHAVAEPTAAEIDAMDWPAWLAREEAAFAEVRREVENRLPAADRQSGNRYWPASPLNPTRLPRDWNRSFEMLPEAPPQGVAVLLHGLSDSPYSLRHLALHYRKRGWAVVAIRLPGHGTTPASLAVAGIDRWQAATRLAVREALRLAGGRPLHLVGYSNGAALAVDHALQALAAPGIGRPEALVLVSPMIGLANRSAGSSLARLAALLPPSLRFSWYEILPEYNPFKYNSFPIRAGVAAARMTRLLAAHLAEAEESGAIAGFPRTLAFQSAVDSTVSAGAVVGFFDRLPANGSELLLFDVNRRGGGALLLRPAAEKALQALLPAGPRPYRILAVGGSFIRMRDPGATAERIVPTGISWPRGFSSLGHTALPFPLTDGLYGATPDPADREGVHLGTIGGGSEPGALLVPPGLAGRVGSNPFFPLVLDRIDRLIDGRPAALPSH